MSERTDSDLVRAVIGGDQPSYAPLVARHQERLYRRALAMLGDPDLAADMVQDAFIRAYNGIDRADPDRFGAWVYQILRNLCLDEIRSPRQRTTELFPDMPSGQPGPEREFERRELADALGVALDAIGPTLREAFVMKHVEGLSYEEMSAQTGAAIGALKMRVKRARETLQERLQPLERDAAM
jgi:RNA polymerase sigma-70 factor, ECF subfamily